MDTKNLQTVIHHLQFFSSHFIIIYGYFKTFYPPLKTTATPFSGTWFTGKNRKMHVLLFVGVVVIVVISDYT